MIIARPATLDGERFIDRFVTVALDTDDERIPNLQLVLHTRHMLGGPFETRYVQASWSASGVDVPCIEKLASTRELEKMNKFQQYSDMGNLTRELVSFERSVVEAESVLAVDTEA